MLNKRFKIAKCKTSLKLATSRIKIMKNKKLIQITQMKRELAQLLESGQDRTARIRVEHVIREEKMIAAYDLIEIYCELIVVRLPIIESQKTCPIDLKEAITSVIFAAPRCSDIPELVDARKNFTAKYGKEFVSAALELRPESGVNRMMVEKLSAVAPDIQTKMKVLSSVAKEHNVKWDPTLFEETESKGSDDLLKAPMNFEKVSVLNVDTPKIQTSNVQNVHIHEEKPNIPNITSTDTNTSGVTSEMMNRRHSFQNNINNSSSSKEKNWKMEFKDATSAAQAAAESAERASMAAKAAARLSSQGMISRQHSTQSHESPKASNNHFKESYNNSFKDRNSQRDTHTSPKGTGVIRKQPSISSSGSHSSTMSEEHPNISSDDIKTSSYIDTRRDYESETDSDDDENPKFGTGFEYDEGEAKSFFPSPGREEYICPIEDTHISSPKNKTRDEKDLQKVKSRKIRIELNDLVEKDDDKKVKSRNSSTVSIKHETKKNDDVDSGNEFKFGTLTGGLRNNSGLKYPPYSKTEIANSSLSFKKLDDDASKPSSFDSRASKLEKQEQSVPISSSESESDDRREKYLKSGSQFTPPDFFFNDGGITDSDEEPPPVLKPTSTRLSRRTKDHVKPKGKSVISSSTKSGMEQDRDTNPESPPNSKAHTARLKNESLGTKPGDKIYEQQSSPRKKIVGSGVKKSELRSESLVEGNEVKKPSHVHPKLPEYDSLAARIQSLRANHQ